MMRDWFSWIRRLFGLAGATESRQILEGITRLNEKFSAHQLTVKDMSISIDNLMTDQIELHKKINMISLEIEEIYCIQDDGMKQFQIVSKEVRNSVQKLLNDDVIARKKEFLSLSRRIENNTEVLSFLKEQNKTSAKDMYANHVELVSFIKNSNTHLYTALVEESKFLNNAALDSKKRDEELMKSLQAIWLVELSNRLEKEMQRT